MKLQPADYVVLALSVVVISIFSFFVYSGSYSEAVVKIESDQETWIYPLDEDRIVDIDGPLGKTVVEIQDNRVRIADSPCPDKVCISQGWISHSAEWAACLPNHVLVSIEGEIDEDIDAVNF